jgi:hypothetical protein
MSRAGDDDALIAALLSAFDERQLASLMRFKAGIVLDEIVDVKQPYRRVVEDVVVELSRNDEVNRLLSLALRERSGNPLLRQVAQARDVQALPAVDGGGGGEMRARGTVDEFVAAALRSRPEDPALRALTEGVAPVKSADQAAPLGEALEAQVARRSALIDFGRFLTRLRQVEQRTCLIRTPEKLGTGFLVGPDALLTNYHVVEGLLKGRYDFSQVECRFDYNSGSAESHRVALSGSSLSHAPFGLSDLTGTGEPAAGELDYALLPLGSPIGEARGWYRLDPLPRIVALNDFVFVCQHANGTELQLAFGEVVEFPGKASRLRYDTTTAGGASGSPCLTPELELVGLHHAADPDGHPRYNQAVPIWLIAAHASKAGVAPAPAFEG